jgi:hypothetical protein
MTGISFYLQVTAFFLAVVVIVEFSWNVGNIWETHRLP